MRKKIVITVLFVAILLVAFGALLKDSSLLSFDVTPNPMEKECIISLVFNAPSPAFVNLYIETLDGILIRNIYTGQSDKMMRFSWDRISNKGHYVPAGTYYVTLSYGNRYTSTKKTIILK
ncbi:MAG: hypothetical protein PHY48_12470 [Candidatus Cloacimonetes bacterium]|nr:hypothetical protein [Candidatus Cloacimonadota bacterium]